MSFFKKWWKVVIWFIGLMVLIGCTTAGEITTTPTAVPAANTGVTLRFIGVPNGVGYELDKEIINDFVRETGIQVEFIPGTESATERITQYQEWLSNQSADIDVYQIDVIWPSLLADHLLDLSPVLGSQAQQHFPAIVQNNTVDGRLVGMPFFTDAGLLYYRTDLLEKYNYSTPPKTWEELAEMAATVQEGERASGNEEFWGYVWQGGAYEGLTCNAFEWQVSFGGGVIVEPEGVVSVNNIDTILAWEMAAGWVGTISPPGVTGFQEEDARSVWQAGQAMFMRNWPYAYAYSQEEGSLLRDKFAVAILPSGGARHAATLGGWQLAVSKYSQHPDEALKFVEYMTSPEVQKRRSIEGSFLPTIANLYDDPDILSANPYYASLKEVFMGGAVARPSGPTGALYNDVSVAYFSAVHDVLSGKKDATTAVTELEQTLITLLKE